MARDRIRGAGPGSKGRQHGRERDAVVLAAALVEGEAAGVPVPHEWWTVAAYLGYWLEEVVRPTLQPRTYQGYEAVVRRHLVPVIGQRPLARLSTRDVRRVLARVRAGGGSARQVQWVHAVLRTALTSTRSCGCDRPNCSACAGPPWTWPPVGWRCCTRCSVFFTSLARRFCDLRPERCR
jgi:hypothetical protein